MISRIRYLSALVFFSITSFTCAQTDQESLNDLKLRIDHLSKLSKDSLESASTKAYQYASEAYRLADSIQYQKGLIDSKIQLAKFYSSTSKYSKCIQCLFDALKIAERNNLIEEKMRIFDLLGYEYINIQKYDQAQRFLDQAMSLTSQASNYNVKAQVLIDIGKVKYITGKFSQALTHFYLALSLSDSITNPKIIVNTYRGLGTVFYYQKKYPWALYYFNLALKESYNNNLMKTLGSIYTLIAHVYHQNDDLIQSLNFNKKAQKVRAQNKQWNHLASSLVNIGSLYLELGQHDSAYKYINEGIHLLRPSVSYNLKTYAYQKLVNLTLEKGEYKNAIRALQLLRAAEDSLRIATSKSEVERVEANYRIAEMEQQNESLQKEIEIQKLRIKNQSYSEFISQLALILVFVVVIFFFYLRERSHRTQDHLIEINTKLDLEVKERKKTEIELRKSEQLYRFVTENTLDLIVRMDRDFNYLYVSPSIRHMFGYEVNGPVSFPELRKLIDPDYYDELLIEYKGMIRTREPILLTLLSTRKDGTTFWAESLINPIFDDQTGKLRETITVIRDISDRVAYEDALTENAKQKELLLREIHHRVKNNFAILISLMNMQKVSSEPDGFHGFLNDLQGRIRTMSLVHELLYRSRDIDYIDFADYMNQLVGIISSTFNIHPVTLHTDYDECLLDVETALPLGLISNEIVTNAYKYAFAERSDGEFWVELSQLGKETRKKNAFTHQLTFRDNGRGLPDGFQLEKQQSMGSQIITLLVDQIDGELHYSCNKGATFTIFFSDEKRS